MGDHDQGLNWHLPHADVFPSIHDDGRTLSYIEIGAGAGAGADHDAYHHPDAYSDQQVIRYFSDQAIPEKVRVRLQPFHVTEWESLYSSVFSTNHSPLSKASFVPIVDASFRVIGHVGWADGNDILVPEATVRNNRRFWSVLKRQRLDKFRQSLLDQDARRDRGPYAEAMRRFQSRTPNPPPPVIVGNCVYHPPGISLRPTLWDQAHSGPLPDNTESVATTHLDNLSDFLKAGGTATVGRHFQVPGQTFYLDPNKHPMDGEIGSPKKPFSSGYELLVLADPNGNLQGVMDIRNNLKTEDEWLAEKAIVVLDIVDKVMTALLIVDLVPIAAVLLRMGVTIAKAAAIRAIRLVLDAAAKAALKRLLEQEAKRLGEEALVKVIEEGATKEAEELAVEEIAIDATTQARWEARGARLRYGRNIKPGKRTNAVGELWRDGANNPERFATKSGTVPAGYPTAEEELTLSNPPRQVIQPEPVEGLNKGIPEHLNDATPAEKRAWLRSPEGFEWQKTHKLDGPFTNMETRPPHAGPRDHDAEAIMFTQVEQRTTEKTVAEFHFKADHPVCPACRDLIFRFRQSRPGIGVIQHSPDTLPASVVPDLSPTP